ncbi:MAG: hypothetical protein GC131_09460 [Alphaproteobacteria bacterium]|nr:hypothetical protein [Alphaproteobacteria bacterium]
MTDHYIPFSHHFAPYIADVRHRLISFPSGHRRVACFSVRVGPHKLLMGVPYAEASGGRYGQISVPEAAARFGLTLAPDGRTACRLTEVAEADDKKIAALRKTVSEFDYVMTRLESKAAKQGDQLERQATRFRDDLQAGNGATMLAHLDTPGIANAHITPEERRAGFTLAARYWCGQVQMKSASPQRVKSCMRELKRAQAGLAAVPQPRQGG